MDHSSEKSEARFEAYIEALVEVIGHADRADPLRDYCTGLLMPVERKRGALGGVDGASEGVGQASIASPLRWPSAIVGRSGYRHGTRPRASLD